MRKEKPKKDEIWLFRTERGGPVYGSQNGRIFRAELCDILGDVEIQMHNDASPKTAGMSIQEIIDFYKSFPRSD